MKVYILTEYDYAEDEVIHLGAYTESALNRKKEEMIKNLEKEYEKKIEKEKEKREESSIERKLLSSEIDRLNILINGAKDKGDEIQYRALRKERKKISHRIQRLASEYSNNIHQLEYELRWKSLDIMRNLGDSHIRIQELDVIE